MSEDVVAKARAALEGVTEGPWEFDPNQDDYLVTTSTGEAVGSHHRNTQFIAASRSLVPELVTEIERLRSYKSLPDHMVWQDYFSPDDVIKIREPLDAEIERLTEQLIDARVAYTNERLHIGNRGRSDDFGMSTKEYEHYRADPRGWMRQKITEDK